MNKEDILKMKEGKELDKLIAEKIFGVQFETDIKNLVRKFSDDNVHWFTSKGCYIDEHHNLVFNKDDYDIEFGSGMYFIPDWENWLIENSEIEYKTPNYSTDISDAWKVVEKLSDSYYIKISEIRNFSKTYTADFWSETYSSETEAGTTPLAICKSALLTVID